MTTTRHLHLEELSSGNDNDLFMFAAATATVEGKVSKPLKKILKKLVAKDVQDQLLVADANLGKAIKEKMSLSCMSSTAVLELMRCIRSQADSLIGSLPSRSVFMLYAIGVIS